MKRESIAELLLDRCGDQRPGLRTRERTWSWDEVVQHGAVRAELAQSLRRDGPFHIGVLLENVAEYVFWLAGAALAGATIVGINPTHRGRTLEQEVRHTECQLIITDRCGCELLEGLDVGVDPSRFLLVDGSHYGNRLARRGDRPALGRGVGAQTRMLLLFTSGTTGASKAAICSQGRLAGLGYQNSAKYDIKAEDVCYCPMPLFHGNALMALWAPALVAGACVALAPKFSASRFLPDVRFFAATFFTYVGTTIGYILAQPEFSDDAENTLTHAFGTEAAPHDQEAFRRRFGCQLMEGYGSSENAGMLRRAPQGPAGSLGIAAKPSIHIVNPATFEPCVAAEIDEYGRVCNAEDAVGEIVDTEGTATFEGYYNNDAANAERVRNGWYCTGDLGYVDTSGYFYFAGRSGNWIRVHGENISALLTERVLARHREVLAASAFAVPDPRSGDQVMAAVETTEGLSFERLRLGEFLERQGDLGTKGAPSFVRVSSSLPTTGSGKLRTRQMQADGWRTSDAVYRWTGRDAPAYELMTAHDKDNLRAEFAASGRLHLLP